MLPVSRRLTTSDVRYIQKQRNVIWTKHFGVLRIRQYPNRRYHQASIYIAAKIVPKSAWRHYLKRRLLAIIEDSLLDQSSAASGGYYKLFIFLNKKTLTKEMMIGSVSERKSATKRLVRALTQERSFIQQKLWIKSN